MIAQEIVAMLATHNIDITLESGEKIKVKAPKGALTPELTTAISTNKQALVEYLTYVQSFTDGGIEEGEQISQLDLTSYPLSFTQQRLWFLDKLQGSSAEYNMPMAFNVSGPLDLQLVQRVLISIIERHHILRSIYLGEGDKVTQHIQNMSDIDLRVEVKDLTALAPELQTLRVTDLVRSDFTRAFDLTCDLMVRVSYIRQSQAQGILLFNMHHIASDGWSVEVLIREFFTLYQAYYLNRPDPLPVLTIQYGDYAQWQRRNLDGPALEKQLTYWQNQLADAPTMHSLPLDFSRPKLKQYQGGSVQGELPASVAQRLLAMARAHQLSPFMLLHGALSLLLSQHANSNDIVIGTPVANRMRAELEPLIGFFANTLVLRVNTQHASLAAYLSHVREVHLGAQSNQDVPFEQLVECLDIPRSAAHNPLFQIVMTTDSQYGVAEQESEEIYELPGVELQPYGADLAQAKFDLDIDLQLTERGLSLRWIYDTSLFTQSSVIRLNDHLSRLLTALSEVTSMEIAPHSLPILSDAEYRYLSQTLNTTAVDYPDSQCIHELFEAQAVQTPEAIAIVDNQHSISYRVLNERANQLAHHLIDHHQIKAEQLIGLCVTRSINMMVSILAILKAGGAYVPLDPLSPPARIEGIINDAGLRLILADSAHCPLLSSFSGETLIIDELSVKSGCTKNIYKKTRSLTSSSLAYVFYTSGSTGQPKGVMIEHSGVINMSLAQQQYCQLTPQSRVMQFASIGFDASVAEWMMALLSGAQLHICPEPIKQAAPALSDWLLSQQITHLTIPPVLLEVLRFHEDYCFEALLVGGEACSASVAAQWARTYAMYNAYGPTEASVCATMGRIEPEKTLHIGRALANMQLYVVSEQGALLPEGCIGELWIGGTGLARGYLNQPELSKEKFISNPFFDGTVECSPDKVYRSGDLVRYLPDGTLEFIGRVDAQVKIRGFRIELGEIESQLNQLPGIDSSLVLVSSTGHDKQILAYIKPHLTCETNSQKASMATLCTQQLAQVLPAYMLPQRLIIVSEWPMNVNGKVDKSKLASLSSHLDTTVQHPLETQTERDLAKIWAQLLAISPEQIGQQANFFTLGGNSILAVKLAYRIEAHFNIDNVLQHVMFKNSLSELASYLDTASTCQAQSVELQHSPLLFDTLSQGAEHTLFAIPGIAAVSKQFQGLALAAHGQFNVIGLNHPELLEETQMFQNIYENARYFAQAIERAAEQSHYHLIGHSYGGILAMEVARELRNFGKSVSLIIIDSYWQQGQLALKETGQCKAGQEDFVNSMSDTPAELLHPSISNVIAAQQRFLQDYVPAPLVPERVALCYAQSSPFQLGAVSAQLSAVFGNSVTMHTVPGDHESILSGEGIERICDIIRQSVLN
ncbi:amino acid adenylation domain-containing protein [Pseudoalteromonas luteoviolacea]|uniref:non-ribosomal peptide synthetase n=1 Tax=Pseudoalteromonas luteoviolacea TaxID=43657 RepID=UPI001B3A06B9|nr:non-ribosomal peptide synthetase [Pseudoalteromonas luteoviolacea]MBQ4878624.1 amino acid adenylation domain-containing protein [Pseudoalteromonas luteoviolacea]MBQ4907164.1 amino acid adenylation domain-containing protein [Pseudoalteromonas luteoviolacea]